MTDTLTVDDIAAEVVPPIVERFNPRRIFLFGSRAYEEPHADSDVDLMIEMETSLGVLDRVQAVSSVLSRKLFAIDVLVYTPEEVQLRQDDEWNILYDIVHSGRVLYERP